MTASDGFSRTPSPAFRRFPSLHCALEHPCSAAFRYQIAASAWSCGTPSPRQYMLPSSNCAAASPRLAAFFNQFLRKNDLADIFQITYEFMVIVPRLQRFGMVFLRSVPDNQIFVGWQCPEDHLPHFPSSRRTSPIVFTSPWISSAYAGTGLRHRSSISRRMLASSLLGIASSASRSVI